MLKLESKEDSVISTSKKANLWCHRRCDRYGKSGPSKNIIDELSTQLIRIIANYLTDRSVQVESTCKALCVVAFANDLTV